MKHRIPILLVAILVVFGANVQTVIVLGDDAERAAFRLVAVGGGQVKNACFFQKFERGFHKIQISDWMWNTSNVYNFEVKEQSLSGNSLEVS